MPRKIRELRSDLQRAGFLLDPRRGKGSHTYWKHPLLPANTATISGHDGDDAQLYQEKIVRRVLAALRAAQEE